ncbi:hypothetical protein BU15DRAFT_61061 [Melanogaster broomeanus]|nr:hypothetical protein BU15DRAFT_61061 [Melanogaster broomeanus]
MLLAVTGTPGGVGHLMTNQFFADERSALSESELPRIPVYAGVPNGQMSRSVNQMNLAIHGRIACTDVGRITDEPDGEFAGFPRTVADLDLIGLRSWIDGLNAEPATLTRRGAHVPLLGPMLFGPELIVVASILSLGCLTHVPGNIHPAGHESGKSLHIQGRAYLWWCNNTKVVEMGNSSEEQIENIASAMYPSGSDSFSDSNHQDSQEGFINHMPFIGDGSFSDFQEGLSLCVNKGHPSLFSGPLDPGPKGHPKTEQNSLGSARASPPGGHCKLHYLGHILQYFQTDAFSSIEPMLGRLVAVQQESRYYLVFLVTVIPATMAGKNQYKASETVQESDVDIDLDGTKLASLSSDE